MRKILFIGMAVCLSVLPVAAQQATAPKYAVSSKVTIRQPANSTLALPRSLYTTLHDSCTSLDVVFSAGTSMSLDGRNVMLFSSFVENRSSAKSNVAKFGFLMWQIRGREFLTGDMYLTGDSTGYLIFNHEGHEYVNALNRQGAAFLRTRGK